MHTGLPPPEGNTANRCTCSGLHCTAEAVKLQVYLLDTKAPLKKVSCLDVLNSLPVGRRGKINLDTAHGYTCCARVQASGPPAH